MFSALKGSTPSARASLPISDGKGTSPKPMTYAVVTQLAAKQSYRLNMEGLAPPPGRDAKFSFASHKPSAPEGAAPTPLTDRVCSDGPAILAGVRKLIEEECGAGASSLGVIRAAREGKGDLMALYPLASASAQPATVKQVADTVMAAGVMLRDHQVNTTTYLEQQVQAGRSGIPLGRTDIERFSFGLMDERLSLALVPYSERILDEQMNLRDAGTRLTQSETLRRLPEASSRVFYALGEDHLEFKPEFRAAVKDRVRQAIAAEAPKWQSQLSPLQIISIVQRELTAHDLFPQLPAYATLGVTAQDALQTMQGVIRAAVVEQVALTPPQEPDGQFTVRASNGALDWSPAFKEQTLQDCLAAALRAIGRDNQPLEIGDLHALVNSRIAARITLHREQDRAERSAKDHAIGEFDAQLAAQLPDRVVPGVTERARGSVRVVPLLLEQQHQRLQDAVRAHVLAHDGAAPTRVETRQMAQQAAGAFVAWVSSQVG